MKKYHDVAIIKEGEKIIAVVRGLCAQSNNWQEYYRQDITDVVQSKVNAPQDTVEQNGHIAQQIK